MREPLSFTKERGSRALLKENLFRLQRGFTIAETCIMRTPCHLLSVHNDFETILCLQHPSRFAFRYFLGRFFQNGLQFLECIYIRA